MPQTSDFLSSSSHGGDDLGYPFSDEIPQLMTETSFSQQSFPQFLIQTSYDLFISLPPSDVLVLTEIRAGSFILT